MDYEQHNKEIVRWMKKYDLYVPEQENATEFIDVNYESAYTYHLRLVQALEDEAWDLARKGPGQTIDTEVDVVLNNYGWSVTIKDKSGVTIGQSKDISPKSAAIMRAMENAIEAEPLPKSDAKKIADLEAFVESAVEGYHLGSSFDSEHYCQAVSLLGADRVRKIELQIKDQDNEFGECESETELLSKTNNLESES